MARTRVGVLLAVLAGLLLAVVANPAPVGAQKYNEFYSEEYGFSMKYPATWVKLDEPKGGYYKVFQTPEPVVGKARVQINVAAHKPVNASIDVFLNEFRNAVKDLQEKSNNAPGSPKQVRQLHEDKYDCDVPGAYYFYIEAFDEQAATMMRVVIVFYKHEDTLVRLSCLAPATHMDQFRPAFTDVLQSVTFKGAQAATPAPGPSVESVQPTRPSAVRPPAPAPAPSPGPAVRPVEREPRAVEQQVGPPPAAPTPSPAPKGPQRKPREPSTGLVE